MKKYFRRMVVALMALTTAISMNACISLNHKTAREVCNRLEAKYGEKFVATHIGDRWNKPTATLYVHPESNSEIVFSAIIDHSGNVTDDYVCNIMMHSIEISLQKAFNDVGIQSAANAVIVKNDIDITEESNTNIQINDFAVKYGVKDIFVKLIFDSNTADASKIVSVLEKISRTYKFGLTVQGYILNTEAFEKCVSDFRTYPSVSPTHIETYMPLCQFSSVISNGIGSLTVDELKAKLEGC